MTDPTCFDTSHDHSTSACLGPHEQPMPVPNDRPSVQGMVIADLQDRLQVGIQRYGTPLQPHNGRDALRDAYEEAMDLCCYLRQAIAERDSPAPGEAYVTVRTGDRYGRGAGTWVRRQP